MVRRNSKITRQQKKIRDAFVFERTVEIIPAKREFTDVKTKKLRVAAYCRVSTFDESQSGSFELQKQTYTERINSNLDWIMAGIYADQGASGTSIKRREQFQQMLHDCRCGKIDLIIVTKRIGFGVTRATSWSNPYELARQFKTLDAVSKGRAAWNAVTGANGISAQAYGVNLNFDRYGKAYEFTEAVQHLWSTWGKDALQLNHSTKEFADYSQVKTVNLKGEYVQTAGTLPIPPSKQGQPVIIHSGGSENSIAFAGKYADVFVGELYTIEQGQAMRQALRDAAVANGRKPDDIKFIAGVMPLMGANKKEAIERHGTFIDGKTLLQRMAYIGHILGVEFTPCGH
ncbi:LLM class flavin-dependent oxidoreductase [Streptococcus pluranimalium]